MLEKVLFASFGAHLKEILGLWRDPSELTLEDFRLELAGLGLLGRRFGPEEYRAALEKHLGIEIHVEGLPDAQEGALAEQLVEEGILAEVVISEESGDAIVLVRESLRGLPWPAYELSIFHELSHLAAGHPMRVKRVRENRVRNRFRTLGLRVARREPLVSLDGEKVEELKREVLEPEARSRAKWLVLAGTAPRAFEAENANRLT